MNQQNNEATAIHAAFDTTGVRFHDRAAALAEFKVGREIIFDDDGNPHTYYDGGEALSLDQGLLRFAYDRRDLCDQRTLPRAGVGAARPGLESKSDYPDVKSKLSFIEARGLDAWSKLPLTGVSPKGEILTQEDFRRLPLAEKVARTNADPLVFSKLPKAPKGESPLTGKTHHAALAKEMKTRGKR
jgi:hypothetical protein